MRTVTAEALMNHSVYQPFLTNAKQALKLCVQYLIDHLPIDTPILVALSAIDPVLYQNLTEETVSFMRQLPRYIKVLSDDERDTYNSELLELSLTKLPRSEDDDNKPIPPDVWWGEVFSQNTFPTIQKVLTVPLGMITGPLVEGNFSEIQDLVSDRMHNMTASTISAYQTVRYFTRANGGSASLFPMGKTCNPLKSSLSAAQSAWRRYKERAASNKEEEDNRWNIYGLPTKVTKSEVRRTVLQGYHR